MALAALIALFVIFGFVLTSISMALDCMSSMSRHSLVALIFLPTVTFGFIAWLVVEPARMDQLIVLISLLQGLATRLGGLIWMLWKTAFSIK